MSDIPRELFPDILSRVHAESLLRFRCVCKAWLRIIDDPSFIRCHLHRQIQSNGDQLIFRNNPGTKLHTLSVDSLYCYEKSRTNTVFAKPLKTLKLPGVPRIQTLPVASCNGQFLISGDNIKDKWAIWNPFTREAHMLPSYGTTVPTSKYGDYFNCVGLGYDSVVDDYKVVKIGDYYSEGARGRRVKGGTLVYSLKSNSWRRVKDCPCEVPRVEVPGVFVNGSLHWISAIAREKEVIHAFDLAIEGYKTLPFPSNIPREGRSPPKTLASLGGYLFITWNSSVYRLDDYGGGENGWMKLFSFNGMRLGNVRPVATSKGEVLLMKRNAKKCILFDIEKKSAKKIIIDGSLDFRSSQFLPANLVRLSNFGGGVVGSKRKRNTSDRMNLQQRSEKLRLELTLRTTYVQKTTNNDEPF